MTGHRLIGVGLIAASFALTAALYPRLPDPMPTCVAILGPGGGLVAKPLGPFVLPLIGLVAYAITAWKLARTEGGRALYPVPVAIAALYLFLVTIKLRAVVGDAADPAATMVAGIGLFLAVLGNYFGKLRRNRWIGIRTPWTLADDEVWLRTHRLGGPLLVAAGLVAFLAAVAGAPVPVALAPVLVALLIPAGYSYLLCRRLRASGASS